MATQYTNETGYAMGYAEEERQRLIEQAAIYGPATQQFFLDAGIRPGMRVLDVGCGVGDVSLLAADLVGPDGTVVGVDTDPLALGTARARAREAGLRTIDFHQGDLHELTFDEPFDAAVGRVILLHVRNPVEAVRRVARHVRPGGVVAFQEVAAEAVPPYYPAMALWERAGAWMTETFRRAGIDLQLGLKLYQVFQDAGLPAPALRADTLVAAGPDSPLYQYMAHTIRSLLPLMERLGIATRDEVTVETLGERLRAEVVAARGVVTWAPLVGAWTRTPDAGR